MDETSPELTNPFGMLNYLNIYPFGTNLSIYVNVNLHLRLLTSLQGKSMFPIADNVLFI